MIPLPDKFVIKHWAKRRWVLRMKLFGKYSEQRFYTRRGANRRMKYIHDLYPRFWMYLYKEPR